MAKADDLPRLFQVEEHEAGGVAFFPCGFPAVFATGVVAVDGVEGGEPAAGGFDGGGGGADFVVGKGNVFDTEDELVVAPVTEVGRVAKPDVEAVVAPASVHGKGTLEARVHAVDFFGEEHHVAVVGDGEGEDFKFVKIVGDRDAAANPVVGVHREADVAAVVDDGEARVVNPPDFIVLNFEPGLGRGLPGDAVGAEGEAEVCAVKARVALAAVVVAKQHDVAALEFRDAGVEDQRRGVRDVLRAEDGVGGMAVDDGGGNGRDGGGGRHDVGVCQDFVPSL